MLKGAIDHISPNEIGGWIYSATASLRNHTVLAFIDDACIGAGRVDLYREDLADAGLGDGFLGFKFPVNLANIDEAPLVVVKLEGSDAVIIQPSARLVRRTLSRPRTIVTARTLASIEWMRARAWLDQTEYDFLRMMFRFGAYDLSLRARKRVERHLPSNEHYLLLIPFAIEIQPVSPPRSSRCQCSRLSATAGPAVFLRMRFDSTATACLRRW